MLFVAHRKEILNQSLLTFRHALRDAAFGELWVDGQKPNAFQHVFASIQSLAVANLQHLDADWFDVLIIDEFHHAAADTYKALIDHLEPWEMLGLTATPERGDGEPILHWFDESIAAELRLWDAIDQHRLCPFAYYGISDGTDLTRIGWRRGSGYDIQQLTNLVTGDGVVARLVIEQTRRHVSDMASMRALGFCVSITHAQFMAAQFEAAGVSALALTSQTPMLDREAALRDLESGKLQIVFTVDLFNEGVDIPSVDTLLFCDPPTAPHFSCSNWDAACDAFRTRPYARCSISWVAIARSFASVGAWVHCWAAREPRLKSRWSRVFHSFPLDATCSWMPWHPPRFCAICGNACHGPRCACQ
ncbi:DEAD/DEAH box helicase family protein [Dokdonella sp.]|uniref:DEAD/DEAH box helicase n=1 Tax=Dokdonella sp. TaxID=2291710 RepID=UPI0025BAAB12|nr:DEAD/DEAH box helicase family protein [Dokdonella sp.]